MLNLRLSGGLRRCIDPLRRAMVIERVRRDRIRNGRLMTERVVLPEKLGPYKIGEHLESGWGWDLYEAYVPAEEDHEARSCHLRIFFNCLLYTSPSPRDS